MDHQTSYNDALFFSVGAAGLVQTAKPLWVRGAAVLTVDW
jgi:hypothetical protein